MSLMVGRLCSFWDGLCTGAMLVSGKVDPHSVHQKNVAWKLRMWVPKGDDQFLFKGQHQISETFWFSEIQFHKR